MKKYGGYTVEELQKNYRDKKLDEKLTSTVDTSSMDSEMLALYNQLSYIIKTCWDANSCEMGLKASPRNYSKDNPLMISRDGFSSTMAEMAVNAIENEDETFLNIANSLLAVPNIENIDQPLLDYHIKMSMEVMGYRALAELIQSIPTHEDFNSRAQNNLPVRDFNKRFNHTRFKRKIISIDETTEIANEDSDLLNDIIAKERMSKIWSSLNEEETLIIKLKLEDKTQKEIAEILGYKTHSAVGKKLAKIKQKVINII